MQLAPIALFAYKRPEHTLKTLTTLSECTLAQESILYIFCDGPKREEDRENVVKVREIAASRKWCGEVRIVPRANNMGLANSIIDGVSRLCTEFGRVIVLEDDLLVAKGFLDYMNRALDLYSDYLQVMQISGHLFPFGPVCEDYDAFFLPLSTTLGWATWRRAWEHFDVKATGYEKLRTNKCLRREFDLDNSYPYSRMMFDQMSGAIDSWGIRWWWTFFKENGLCLYPRFSLIEHIGFDNTATHATDKVGIYDGDEWTNERVVRRLPGSIEASNDNYDLLKSYFRKFNNKRNIYKYILQRIKVWVIK